MYYASIGSISSGTLNPEDLIHKFMDELQYIIDNASLNGDDAEREAFKPTYEEMTDFMAAIESHMNIPRYYMGPAAIWDDIGELSEWLDEFAPPLAYFGAHPDDAAEFGYWIDHDSIEEEIYCDEILKIDAGDEWPENVDEYEYVLEVTDHGNVTLFTTDHKEIWSVV